MCHSMYWFSTHRFISGEIILLGNNAPCKIVGKATIHNKMQDGAIKTLFDVKHVHYLKKNLISLGVLDAKGFRFIIEGGVLNISKDARFLMRGNKVGNLFTLEGLTVTSSTTIKSFM